MKIPRQILQKLKIDRLNPMQEVAFESINRHKEVILLSPTGTGKTLAFLLPIIAKLDPEQAGLQVLVLAPSRELALQIEQVAREMGSGFKVNAAYGGRKIAKDRAELAHTPSILIGTPGRLADHIRRGTFSCEGLKYLVLDEFDKSLEIGFEKEMKQIIGAIPQRVSKILTSATYGVEVPAFVQLKEPELINYAQEANKQLEIRRILSPSKDKLKILGASLRHLGPKSGIVFCNYKDSIQRVSDFLTAEGIDHACFYGGMEQKDRERALIKFRNGTHRLLLATDLAARGIDVQALDFIIHYHLPSRAEEFTHRNGRTARMHEEGAAYVLQWEQEPLPDFVGELAIQTLEDRPVPEATNWQTLFVSGGRRDKISKGDIAGLFMKKGGLKADKLGLIELKNDCAFVAVSSPNIDKVLIKLDQQKLKTKKVKVFLV
ncbi:MAG: DEAD/DEAH box helicase [Bacteroidota bacterium]